MERIEPGQKIDLERKIRVGTSLIRNLSTTFYPNTAMIFEELVTNARDAMAKKVDIRVGGNEIVVEDDGEGMDPSQLRKFFYISYSDKPLIPMKTRKDMTRQIIGRFGIGKLSLYQICGAFTIESWRGRAFSRATFDFDSFEGKQFIDDFDLDVETLPVSNNSSGTRIVLSKLRHEKVPKLKEIVTRLSKSMPMDKKFVVRVGSDGLPNPYVIKASKLPAGSLYTIDTDKEEWKSFRKPKIGEPELGKITGTVIYKPTEKRESGDYGVFVRVFGRRVNTDSPIGIMDFARLTHARMFARRIYADFNIDSLADALMTNRAGFLSDDKKFIFFRDMWLKDLFNYLNEIEYKKYKKFMSTEEREQVRTEVSAIIQDMLENIGISNRHIKVDSEDRPKLSEPVLRKGKDRLAINSAHPLYGLAKKVGKTEGIKLFSSLLAAVEVALSLSKNLEDFRMKFYSMLAGEPAYYDKKPKGGKDARMMPKVQ